MRISGITFVLIAVAMAFLATAPAEAAVELRFSPADTTIAPFSPARMAVYVDQEIDLRTIEISVSYDTTVITSIAGGPGSLFTDSGFFLYSAFEEDVPGTWHGYSVIMGAGDFVTGPGELYIWDVTGNAVGITAITVQEAKLYNPAGSSISDVSLISTTISVDEAVPASSVPLFFPGKLVPYPNPFNPRTAIQFELPEPASVFLAVYDARGRQIAVLLDRFSDAGYVNATWDGKNSAGLEQPGGVYFFRMETTLGQAWAKGVLLK